MRPSGRAAAGLIVVQRASDTESAVGVALRVRYKADETGIHWARTCSRPSGPNWPQAVQVPMVGFAVVISTNLRGLSESPRNRAATTIPDNGVNPGRNRDSPEHLVVKRNDYAQ
jgi:hypothetical protein